MHRLGVLGDIVGSAVRHDDRDFRSAVCRDGHHPAATPRSTPTATPTTTTDGCAPPPLPTPTPIVTWWDTVTSTIAVDPTVVGAVTNVKAAARRGFVCYPAEIQLVFASGPSAQVISGNVAGYVSVYRLADVRDLHIYDDQLMTLAGLLKDRIDLRTRYPYYVGLVAFQRARELDPIPGHNAAPAWYARPHYVDGDGFSAVAYLTNFVQSDAWVNIDHATYVVQGLTRDGTYFIDAEFAARSTMVSAALIPTFPPSYRPEPSYVQFWNGFLQEIDARPDSAFAPSLARVDAMLRTLRITGP